MRAFEPLVPKRTLIGYPPVAPDKNWPNPCDCHIITMHCDNQSNKHAYFEDNDAGTVGFYGFIKRYGTDVSREHLCLDETGIVTLCGSTMWRGTAGRIG